jgi:hypothetical protein
MSERAGVIGEDTSDELLKRLAEYVNMILQKYDI